MKTKKWYTTAESDALIETMLAALKAVRISLLDDELYAQTKDLRETVDNAIARAEGH